MINIAQRREEGFSDWRADALDGLTIVGNIFAGAGTWTRGATIITKDAKGKVVKYSLIGQVGTDGGQGVLLAQQQIEQYDKIMSNPSLSPRRGPTPCSSSSLLGHRGNHDRDQHREPRPTSKPPHPDARA